MKVEEVNVIEGVDYNTLPIADQGKGSDLADLRYQRERITHWDDVARCMDSHRGLGGAYQRRIAEIYEFFVPQGSRVLEIDLLGNKFFSLALSWLLGQPIKDTLCGTKVLWRTDYQAIAANRSYFGDFDPFGDFDLLFGASKLSMKILDVPIRYRDRAYGTTNIQRWSHGWLLLRMVFFAARRIKFV